MESTQDLLKQHADASEERCDPCQQKEDKPVECLHDLFSPESGFGLPTLLFNGMSKFAVVLATTRHIATALCSWTRTGKT